MQQQNRKEKHLLAAVASAMESSCGAGYLDCTNRHRVVSSGRQGQHTHVQRDEVVARAVPELDRLVCARGGEPLAAAVPGQAEAAARVGGLPLQGKSSVRIKQASMQPGAGLWLRVSMYGFSL